jgi:hypothetical protein
MVNRTNRIDRLACYAMSQVCIGRSDHRERERECKSSSIAGPGEACVVDGSSS